MEGVRKQSSCGIHRERCRRQLGGYPKISLQVIKVVKLRGNCDWMKAEHLGCMAYWVSGIFFVSESLVRLLHSLLGRWRVSPVSCKT